MIYSTRTNWIKIDDNVAIRFTDNRYKNAQNPKGVIPARFDISPTLGIYKFGKGHECIRWFLVEQAEDKFLATEIEISEVYQTLVEHGKWLQPDSLNAAKSNKYRPVYNWLLAS